MRIKKLFFVVVFFVTFFLYYSAPESPETIELEINTLSVDGLVLWQGVVGSDPYLAVHMQST